MPILGKGDVVWSNIHVDDAASAFVAAVEAMCGGGGDADDDVGALRGPGERVHVEHVRVAGFPAKLADAFRVFRVPREAHDLMALGGELVHEPPPEHAHRARDEDLHAFFASFTKFA